MNNIKDENIKNGDLRTEYKDEDFPIYYSNGISITPSYFDFQYTFSNQYLIGEDNNVLARKDLCKIFMSPEHAKVFNNMLSHNINEYEKRFGAIKVPQEFYLGTGKNIK